MKKVLFICAIALCLVLLTACGKKSVNPNSTQNPSPIASVGASGTSSPAPPSPGTVIIAESSNAVSDKEKQAVLDNLSREIDEAFNAGRGLEDLDNSDIDTGNIQ